MTEGMDDWMEDEDHPHLFIQLSITLVIFLLLLQITDVRNTIQVFTRNGSIELEKNPQAVSVDTCVTVASHLFNRMENLIVIVFIDIKGRIQLIQL